MKAGRSWREDKRSRRGQKKADGERREKHLFVSNIDHFIICCMRQLSDIDINSRDKTNHKQ